MITRRAGRRQLLVFDYDGTLVDLDIYLRYIKDKINEFLRKYNMAVDTGPNFIYRVYNTIHGSVIPG